MKGCNNFAGDVGDFFCRVKCGLKDAELARIGPKYQLQGQFSDGPDMRSYPSEKQKIVDQSPAPVPLVNVSLKAVFFF